MKIMKPVLSIEYIYMSEYNDGKTRAGPMRAHMGTCINSVKFWLLESQPFVLVLSLYLYPNPFYMYHSP